MTMEVQVDNLGVIKQELYSFNDGRFRFYTALYGSWANDMRIVFRVREDRTPKERAEEKEIRCYDRLVPSTEMEIAQWIMNKKFFPLG